VTAVAAQQGPNSVDVTAYTAQSFPEDLVRAWLSIQAACPELDHPQLAPGYFQAVAAARPDVEIAVLWSGNDPVGFLPFHRDNSNRGLPVGAEISDWHGVVVRPDIGWNAESVLRGARLSAFSFHHLLASQRPFLPHHTYIDPAYQVSLGEGFDDFVAERKSLFAQARRKARKLEREHGALTFKFHDEAPQVIDQLLDWKNERVRQQGFASKLDEAWVRALALHLQTAASDSFSGAISTLYAGEKLLAAHIGMYNTSVLASWVPSHSKEYEAYSPGMLLTLELIRSAHQRGIRRIDLGRGENPLKLRLSNDQVMLAVGSVETRSSRRLFNHGRERLRTLSHKVPVFRSAIRAIRRGL